MEIALGIKSFLVNPYRLILSTPGFLHEAKR